jgi:hypothetical protein
MSGAQHVDFFKLRAAAEKFISAHSLKADGARSLLLCVHDSVLRTPAFTAAIDCVGLIGYADPSAPASDAARRASLRLLWLQTSHVGSPVCLGAPVDVRDIFSRHPDGSVDIVDGSGGVIAPTADQIAKGWVTGEAVIGLVTFT